MKILLGFFLAQTLAFAQTWAPIGAKWTYTQHTIQRNYTTFKTYDSVGDTVISGQPCKILTIVENMGPGFADTSQRYTYSENNRVYFYKDPSWCLLYDFNVRQGDTFLLDCWSLHVKNLSIDTVTINGHQRLRFHYASSDLVLNFM